MKTRRKAPQLKALGFKSCFVAHQTAGRAVSFSAVVLAKALELAAMLTGKG